MTREAPLALCLLAAVHLAAQGAAIQTLPIIPRPAVVRHLNGTFLLGRSAVVYADPEARPVAEWFAEQLRSEFGIAAEFRRKSPAQGRAFRFLVDTSLPEEGYRLRIEPRGVTIVGPSRRVVLRGAIGAPARGGAQRDHLESACGRNPRSAPVSLSRPAPGYVTPHVPGGVSEALSGLDGALQAEHDSTGISRTIKAGASRSSNTRG